MLERAAITPKCEWGKILSLNCSSTSHLFENEKKGKGGGFKDWILMEVRYTVERPKEKLTSS